MVIGCFFFFCWREKKIFVVKDVEFILCDVKINILSCMTKFTIKKLGNKVIENEIKSKLKNDPHYLLFNCWLDFYIYRTYFMQQKSHDNL